METGRRREDPVVDADRCVRETWSAISVGDLSVLESVLAPEAKWRAVEDGPWNCENRSMILRAMQDRAEQLLGGEIDSVVDLGDRVVVGFRPLSHGPDAWPLDDGVRYLVLTRRDELVIEMKGCADRMSALEYAGAG
jgi:ketosteroid isomerase-like protein